VENRVPIELDRIDRAILAAIQSEGRIQNLDLAARVGLSPSPCLRRLKRLEDAGVVRRYVALLDADKIGIGLSVYARIALVAQDAATVENFAQAMNALPQVVECHIMAGECDALLRVVASDLDGYRNFQITHLTRENGVQSVKTDVPIQTVKSSTELPV
jgi:Lrp/AsnC family transcriptional regulator, leucine-responsive regulatory protein